jgi:hypothetical protein
MSELRWKLAFRWGCIGLAIATIIVLALPMADWHFALAEELVCWCAGMMLGLSLSYRLSVKRRTWWRG